MAQASQEASNTNDALLSLLKVNNKGWNIDLFEDKIRISAALCEHCSSVCCDAVELGCDHEDDDIGSYCKNCLNQVISNNNDLCPINGHTNPIISSVRSVRRQITKAIVLCPNSMQYKISTQNQNMYNRQIIDTIGNDQKEGVAMAAADTKGCRFKGSLSNLIENHLSECLHKYDPSYSQRISIQKLQIETEKLNDIIDEQKREIFDLRKHNDELEIDIDKRRKEKDCLQQQLTQQFLIFEDKEEEIKRLKRQIVVCEGIEQNREENDKLIDIIDQQKTEIFELKRERNKLKTDIDNGRYEKDCLLNEQFLIIEGKEREIERLKSQIVAYEYEEKEQQHIIQRCKVNENAKQTKTKQNRNRRRKRKNKPSQEKKEFGRLVDLDNPLGKENTKYASFDPNAKQNLPNLSLYGQRKPDLTGFNMGMGMNAGQQQPMEMNPLYAQQRMGMNPYGQQHRMSGMGGGGFGQHVQKQQNNNNFGDR